MTTEKILMRVTPCNCGCKGRDPSHAMHLRRRVTNIVETRETRELTTGEQVVIIERGTIVHLGQVVAVEHRTIEAPYLSRPSDLGWSKVGCR